MIYSLTAIIIAINFLFSAPLNVYAAEDESTTDEYETSDLHDGLYSLQDCLDDIPQAMQQLKDVATSFGQAADATVSTLVNAPIKAVASSFCAIRDDARDAFFDALKNNRDFMKSIFIDPFTKSFKWGKDAVRHGTNEGRRHFYSSVFYDKPDGFHVAFFENYYQYGTSVSFNYHPNTAFFTSDDNSVMFAVVGSGASTTLVFCSSNSLNKSGIPYYVKNADSYPFNPYIPTSNDDSRFSVVFTGHLSTSFTVGDKQYFYSSLNPRGYGFEGDLASKYGGVYSSVGEAVSAFYGFAPSVVEEPNGKGYLRPVNINITANGGNVYNTDWDKIITNNYTTYGDTFNQTIVNNYYYNQTSNSTPQYWYDVYPVEETLPVENTYDDLQNVTFENPNLQTDNGFVSDLFAALPVAVSGFMVSMVLLFVVVLFLRG